MPAGCDRQAYKTDSDVTVREDVFPESPHTPAGDTDVSSNSSDSMLQFPLPSEPPTSPKLRLCALASFSNLTQARA